MAKLHYVDHTNEEPVQAFHGTGIRGSVCAKVTVSEPMSTPHGSFIGGGW